MAEKKKAAPEAAPVATFADFGLEPCVLKVADLIPYARNSRVHTDEQVSEIAASIK